MSTPAHRPRYSYREYLLLEEVSNTKHDVVRGSRQGDPEDSNSLVNPIVLVEVLSPRTAEHDRVEKVGHYRQIPSLRDIVLVDHRERLIEVWSRVDDGNCTRRKARSGQAASLGVTLDVDEVYRDPLSDSPGGA